MKRKFILSLLIILTVAFAIGCNSNQPSLNPKDGESLNEKEEIKVETKTISDDNEALQSTVSFPVFSSEKNQEALDEINKIFEEDALSIKEDLTEMAENDFESFKKDNINFHKYELLIDYEIHTINNELISATSLNYQYTGGAHGMSVKVPYNFDLATGKRLSLNDLFKEGSNYTEVINKEVQKQIQENPDIFFPDEVELFSGIADDQSFYIKDGKLFIYFGQYDIAPYSSGIIEFEIPSSTLKNVATSSFIK